MAQNARGKQGQGIAIGYMHSGKVLGKEPVRLLTDYERWKAAIVEEVECQLEHMDELIARGLQAKDAQSQVLINIAIWLSSAARVAETLDNKEEAYGAFEDMSVLTQRQREIMALVGLRIKPRRIAELLSLSVGTVQGHIRDARKRIRESPRGNPDVAELRG